MCISAPSPEWESYGAADDVAEGGSSGADGPGKLGESRRSCGEARGTAAIATAADNPAALCTATASTAAASSTATAITAATMAVTTATATAAATAAEATGKVRLPRARGESKRRISGPRGGRPTLLSDTDLIEEQAERKRPKIGKKR